MLMDHIARVHAMNMYRITDVTMFMLPTTEPFMPWLLVTEVEERGTRLPARRLAQRVQQRVVLLHV